jgi:DNA polymerase-3 subunit alpha
MFCQGFGGNQDFPAQDGTRRAQQRGTQDLLLVMGIKLQRDAEFAAGMLHRDGALQSVAGQRQPLGDGAFQHAGGGDGDGADTSDSAFTIKVPDEEWDDKHKLALEREMLGLYVSGHPLDGVAHLLAAQVDTAIPAILDGDVANDAQVRVGGILASVNRRVNKSGMPWASAQLEDLTGGIEVMFFPQTYSLFGMDIADDSVVIVGAKVRIQDDRRTLIANDLVVPDFSHAQPDRPLAVSLPTRQCTLDKVTALKQVLARHPGTSQVHLRLISGDRITTLELDQSLRVGRSKTLRPRTSRKVSNIMPNRLPPATHPSPRSTARINCTHS